MDLFKNVSRIIVIINEEETEKADAGRQTPERSAGGEPGEAFRSDCNRRAGRTAGALSDCGGSILQH